MKIRSEVLESLYVEAYKRTNGAILKGVPQEQKSEDWNRPPKTPPHSGV
jgi:hypothetical protein